VRKRKSEVDREREREKDKERQSKERKWLTLNNLANLKMSSLATLPRLAFAMKDVTSEADASEDVALFTSLAISRSMSFMNPGKGAGGVSG